LTRESIIKIKKLHSSVMKKETRENKLECVSGIIKIFQKNVFIKKQGDVIYESN